MRYNASMMVATDPSSASDRASVTVSRKLLRLVDAVAVADGLGRLEAFRQLVSIGLFVRDQVLSGAEILIQRPSGAVERVVFPHCPR